MFKMFAIICAVTVFECNTMYEDPPRVFETKEQCMVAAQMKKDLTIEALTDEDGYLTVEHFEVGCEAVNNVTSAACGESAGGITNDADSYTSIKALGIRFQTKW